jgi:hypothetical protein
VHGELGRWTFIDWDLAAPGRLTWDLAWALLSFVPLMPRSMPSDSVARHRIAVFRAAYGACLPSDVLTVAVERCGYEAECIERLGTRGVEPYARLLADGHAAVWRSAEDYIAGKLQQWEPALA